MTICWARNSVSLWMARERIAFECGRKNIGLSRITKDEETQTSNKELNKLLARVSFLKEPQERNLFRTTIVSLNRGSFPFSPKFRTFQLEIKIWNGPFRFGPAAIFGTTFEDGLHWDRPGHFCRSYRNVPFHLTKLLSTVPLLWVLLTITITKRAGGLGRVCATGMYCSIRLVKCPNFHKRNFCWMESATECKGLQNDRCSDQPHNLRQRSLLRRRFSCLVTHSFPRTCGGGTRDEDLRKSA